MHDDVGTLDAFWYLSTVQAAPHRWIDAIEPRTHFTGATDATNPAKCAIGARILDACIGDKRAEAVPCNATRGRAGAARDQSVRAIE